MSDAIVIAALGQYSDGQTVRTAGLSTARYRDPALESLITDGVFLPVIEGYPGWSEGVRFQPQGGRATTQVQDLTLINTGREFDAWTRYSVAGLVWVVKQGRPGQSWDELELLFKAIGRGGLEYEGRERVIVRLRDRFAALEQPVSQSVYDTDTPNERLVNRLRPSVYGDVSQVAGDLFDPPFFRIFTAANLAVTRRVTEGARPTEAWIDVEGGHQITQSIPEEALPIRADISGPAKPEAELSNLLEDIGGFTSWTGDDPDGWTVVETPPDSEIEEDTVNGGALITSTLASSDGGDDLNAGAAARALQSVGAGLVGYDTSDTIVPDLADWPALINADDAAKLRFNIGGASLSSARLTLTEFGGALGASATVTGITVAIRAVRTGAGGGITFSEVRLLLPNGSVSVDKSAATALTTTKTVHEFGGADDPWGLTLTPGLINDPGFGLRLRFRSASSGSFPSNADVHEVTITAHTGSGSETAKLYVDLGMVIGDRVRIRIVHDDLEAGKTISAKWAGVENALDPIPDLVRVPGTTGELAVDSANTDDPSVVTTAVLDGAGEVSGEFIVDGPVLGIEFFSRPGQTGTQRITRIDLDEISISVNRLQGIARAILTDAGFDPDQDLNNAALEAIAIATADPAMGRYIRNQTARDQLLTLLFHSAAAAGWGGLNGVYQCAMMALPGAPASGQFLRIGPERNAGPSLAVIDAGDQLRDRTHAAENVDPLAENDLAGPGPALSETQRQLALADWRITERVDWDAIVDGTVWPIAPIP